MQNRDIKNRFRSRPLVCSVAISIASMVSTALAAPPAGYTLSWADEFNGTAIDTTQWDYRLDTRFWSIQQAANVSVGSGYLNLQLKKETVGTFNYTAGGVITKSAVRYGYYETSMKTPPGAGWHTSFWMMRNASGSATGTSATYIELDALENDSLHPTYYGVNVHRHQPTHTTFGTKTINTANLNSSFHTVGCEFMPSYVKYYFDGTLVQTVDATQFPHSDLNIWLTSVAAPLGGTTAVDDTKLPAVAQYDYVRYYTPNTSTAQTIYQWNGTSNSTWTTASNWNASPGTGTSGATFNARLQVYNGTGNALIYDSSLGTTRYYNVYERGLVVGNSGKNGSLTISGGLLSTYNSAAEDVIANTTGVTGTLTVAGGAFTGNIFGTILGFGGTCSGNVVINSGSATFSKLVLGNASSASTSIDLNGGTLTANQILTNNTSGSSTFRFNGGTLKAGAASTTFFQGIKNTFVKSAGAIIDTNGKDITIAQPLLADPTSAGGGLTKNGTGTLTLSGNSTYSGPTNIANGTLIFSGILSPASPGALNVTGTSVASIDGGKTTFTRVAASNLNILNGGVITIPANGSSSSVSLINTLNITSGGKLDLKNNDLVLDYTGKSSSYSVTIANIKSGLALLGGADANFDGIGDSGIGSSIVDQQTVIGTTLGVVDGGDAHIIGAITSLSGFTIPNPSTSVIVKYTWFGDSNIDGKVDGSDYALLDSGFTSGGTLAGWVFGDYDYSGSINGSDYALIDTGFISQSSVLPEPALLCPLFIYLFGLSRRTFNHSSVLDRYGRKIVIE